MSYCFTIFTLKKNSEKLFLFILISCFFTKALKAEEDDACSNYTLNLCLQQLQAVQANPLTTPQQFSVAECGKNLQTAYPNCSRGNELTLGALSNATQTVATTTTNTLSGIPAPMDVGAATTTTAASAYSACASAASTAAPNCAAIKQAPHCQTYVKFLTNKCSTSAADATKASAQQSTLSKAGDALTSNWKPLLIGAAVGAGAMALMGGKKGGDGNSTPPPAPKPADKLPDLKLNGSSSSAASTPSVVYYPPSNNNGSLGNPAVIGPTTSTSTPADTVKVAGITPSTSFASGQGSSIGPDTSSRTISSSGAAAPASASSGGTGSTDSGGGVGGGGSDSASLVDASGKSAGGGGSFSGGIDGGSGSSAQAASADGTMLTGIPGGKSDPQSAKVKALALKKEAKPAVEAAPPPAVKVAPAVKEDLKQYMRSKHLIE